MEAVIPLAVITATSVAMMFACNFFEPASIYLGRNLPPGVRGTLINGTASSLPELFTTFCFLFLFHDTGGFAAGIATCAGSAVFNEVVILALVIFGAKRSHELQQKNQILTQNVRIYTPFRIVLNKKVVMRDAIFFIAPELLLVWMLSTKDTLTWRDGASLLFMYAAYFSYLMYEISGHEAEPDDEDYDGMTTGKAWRHLTLATSAIAVACYGLSWAVVELAVFMEVPTFLVAVLFASAATSLPDAILSYKDAVRGECDDAVSNAVGSNIFDITICLGLPLTCYGLVYGDVPLGNTDTQALRIGLLLITSCVSLMLLRSRGLTVRHGIGLLVLFVAWVGFVVSFVGG